MNIIPFPNNLKEKYKTNDKLRIAYKLIEEMNDDGMDFHIVVERKDADKVFELGEKNGKNIILTSNLEKARELKIKDEQYFIVEGDEF